MKIRMEQTSSNLSSIQILTLGDHYLIVRTEIAKVII